jgi:hypothetical protein
MGPWRRRSGYGQAVLLLSPKPANVEIENAGNENTQEHPPRKDRQESARGENGIPEIWVMEISLNQAQRIQFILLKRAKLRGEATPHLLGFSLGFGAQSLGFFPGLFDGRGRKSSSFLISGGREGRTAAKAS